MGTCASNELSKVSERVAEMIRNVDENDIEKIRNVLAFTWNIYNLLTREQRAKLDFLAKKAALNSP